MSAPTSSELHDWLRRLRWALGALPERDRDDIVAETRAHLEERVAGGESPERALAAFGAPEVYARQFVDEMELAGALGSQHSGAALSAVARRVHRSLVAASALVLVTILSMLALLLTSTAVLKVSNPTHVGLWRHSRGMFLGIIDDPANGQELLGAWLFPLAGLGLALAWWIGRVVLLGALRTLASNLSNQRGMT